MERFISLLGLFVMMLIAWLMSTHKKKVSPRIVIGGLALQFIFALFVLKTAPGQILFTYASNAFNALISCTDAGCGLLFGDGFREHFLAFSVLPTIIFFSAFMSIFYHYGIMQWVVGIFAKAMQKTLGTSGAETLSAAANVFAGQTEAPLVIRPYISTMTMSELNSVMVGGFATIAGGVLAAYAGMGIEVKDLLAASVISAPAALLIAKIMEPEVETPKTLGEAKLEIKSDSVNVLDAISSGTVSGLQLALNVGAMLIVFTALIAAVNGTLDWAAHALGQTHVENGVEVGNWSLEILFGYLFAPIAWVMGIPWEDCLLAGELLGIKWFATEFIAYQRLGEWSAEGSGVELAERSKTILTYALCGFANFASIGIQLGGIGGIAPDRRHDLAKLGLRAMIGGSLAAFMTACIAGIIL